MYGITLNFWIRGEEVKRFVERRDYKHQTIRKFLYDCEVPKEEVKELKRSLLNKRYAWRTYEEYEYLKSKFLKWWNSYKKDDPGHTYTYPYGLGLRGSEINNLARDLISETIIEEIYR